MCTHQSPSKAANGKGGAIKAAVLILLLLAALALLYAPTGAFEFLRLDDHDYTFRCLFVKDGLSVANIREAFTNLRHAAIWMPVTFITYMADITLFGPGMGPHHLVNAALHALNALLLVALLTQLARRDDKTPSPTAVTVLLAALWALHPQRVEAVAWIAGRKELLCTGFTLLGLLCWLRPGGVLRALGTVLCCALACLSKPTAMCFPFLAFALRRLAAPQTIPRRRDIAVYAALLACAAATGAIAVYSQTHPEGLPELALYTASLSWRLLNAAVTVGLDLFQSIVPVGLHLDYRATPGAFPLGGTCGLVTLALAVALFAFLLVRAWKRRGNGTRFGSFIWSAPGIWMAVFGLAALAPTLGVFGSFGEAARADRFFYLPSIALELALQRFFATRPPRFATSTLPVLLAILLVLPVTANYVASYRNDYTAFSRTLAMDPAHGRALAHVASEECARFGRIDRGIDLYRRSQALRPRDDTAAQLAYALALRGRAADDAEIRALCAKFACDHTLDRKGMALEALGMTAMRQRRWKEAISFFEDSIKAPGRFYSAEDALLRLGACYCNAKRPADAIRVFEPLTQSRRADIAPRARQFLATLKQNTNVMLMF